MASASASVDDDLQKASAAFQALNNELSAAVDARQRLDAQLAENEQVKKEFAGLKEHNTVYKMVGPVLVQQEHAEARQTVDKRLEFIRGELSRVETQIKDVAAKAESKKAEIAALQGQRIQTRPGAVAAA
ncbi:Prefoldin beta-like protein [Exidia glandulosa HHB12029]|uniref:Prefoldin beta-like protein n=1 Tax=Exidia glandulosa HHB12029 TaxID=1314781 RepID=A0A165BR19_EXIGL|nr:Prefoldin beta-like protein [Exidia glandulosa HHB12029]